MLLYIQDNLEHIVLEWDVAKRAQTLQARGLDFADVGAVLRAGVVLREDRRRDYGERRFIATGLLQRRVVTVVFTDRSSQAHPGQTIRRIISMRRANRKEVAVHAAALRAISDR
jgi:uncharacterized protein